MDCNCGNKNEMNFPPSVLQVNSTECPVLFHKVVIPTNFGDETETPVLMGKYKNALVYYEVNGHAYLYSSDGVPTRLDRGGASVLYVEELPETSKAMQNTLYVSSRGELAVYKSGDKKILNEKPTYYTALGDNTDGAMTQKAVTDALSALSEEVKNKLAEFKNGVVDKVIPEVNDKVSGMERFVTTKIEEMKRETSTLVNTTTNDVNLMKNSLNKHIEQADITKNDLLDKIRRNTDSINDTKNSLRNYALISDVDSRVSDVEARANNKITQAETRVNNTIGQAKTELNNKITEANNNTSSLDAKFTKLTSDNKAEAAQIKANLATTNSVLSTHKELVDKKFTDVNTEQTSQNSLISDILNAFSKESEKGTNLKLNSSATKVLGMTIYGNMAQDKTNGYNLLTLNKTQSSSGVNFTVRDTGYIEAKGTLVNNWARLPFNEFTLLPGTYTLSREGNTNHLLIIDSNDGGNHTIAKLEAGQSKVTFTVSKIEYGCYLAYLIGKGANINISARFMLEAGSVAHPYEPSNLGYQNLFDEFSGLPVTVHGAKLENKDGTLKLTGKPAVNWLPMITRENINLLDKKEYTIVNYAGNNEQLFVQVVATKKDGTGKDFFGGIRYKTEKFTTDSTKYSQYDMKVGLNLASKYPEPVTLLTNVALYKGGFNDDNFPEYTPYASGFATPRPKAPQTIKELAGGKVSFTGKNLFDTRFGNRTLNNVEIKTYEDGSFELNGTPTIGFSLINIFNSNTYIQSGKYKLKIEHLGGSVEKVWSGAYFVHTIPIQKGEQIYQAVLRPEDLNNSSKEFLITVGETLNDYYTPFVWIPHNAATNQAFWNYKKLRLRITLVKDGEDTEFTPFETTGFPLPSGLNLYKLTDDIYDEVKLENGVAKLIKRVGKLELTGEEEKITHYFTTPAGTIGFKYKNSTEEKIFVQQDSVANIICSHFNAINEDAVYTTRENKTGVAIYGGSNNFPKYTNTIAFWFKVTDQAYMKITDVASFRNWLKAEKAKGTPVTIYYEMKTPTEEEITDPAILTKLNKLMEARTYDGVTNISVTGTNLTPEIKVKYMRKIGE